MHSILKDDINQTITCCKGTAANIKSKLEEQV